MDSYVLYAVSVNGTLIDGITRQSITANNQLVKNHNDGSVDVRYITTMSRRSVVSFGTRAIAKALDVVGCRGIPISTNVTLFWQKNDPNGERESGSDHVKTVIAGGLVVPRTLSAQQDGEAELACDVIPVSTDGATDPITITDSQALAGSPDSDQKFTLGKCSFNGIDLQAQSLEIDFGLQVVTRSHSGLYLALEASKQVVTPVITVTTLDMGVTATIGLSGTAQSVTDSVFYVRKLDENGHRVADATEQHISFTVDEGKAHTPDASGDGENDANATVQLDVAYDGSNAPLVLDTTAAIA